LKKRISQIKARIIKTAQRCGRSPESVRLVVATKDVPAERVREAIAEGITILGENYIQEAREKINLLSSYDVSWHFIGHLQTNKARYAVKLFELIHSVDSIRLARELNKEAKKIHKIQPILIQVNIEKESTKSGVKVAEIGHLIREINHLENLTLKGLMTMPPYFHDPEKARPYFIKLRDLRNRFQQESTAEVVPNTSMDELSMGMSGDFEIAIECGATFVRIGRAIFGARN
jgi:pyridoxal phosphate enzyme (YggS family)